MEATILKNDIETPVRGESVGTLPAAATTSTTGLTAAEVERRRKEGQGNAYHPATSRTYVQILRYHAFSFINTILFVLGITLVALGRIDDAILTAGMVVLNVIMGVSQEGRAKQRLDKIALLNRPRASVVRDGEVRSIDPAEIVLGDLLEVRAGDQIVVDGQVVGQGRIEVDESLLTGESDRMPKQQGDQVYSGSFCVSGTARYVAAKVGADSLANEMTRSAQAFRQVKTPLQLDVDYIIRLLVLATTMLGILIGMSFMFSELALVERVQQAAVLAALVPQGLFAMITVTYAMGALRMAGKGALIQQINAIESLSNVDVLCLDKTGTLTTNTLELDSVRPLGTVGEDDLRGTLGDFVVSLTDVNRTSEAIAAAMGGSSRTLSREVAFSSARKWSALSFKNDLQDAVYVLGAPEMLIPALASSADVEQLTTQVAEWSERGLRVLLFARALPQGGVELSLEDEEGEGHLPAGLVPLGLISLRDELRTEAQSTLRAFAAAGVQIKIISGDNAQTVASLARQAGLTGDLKLVSGLDLAAMNEEEFAQAAVEGVVFGRITPQQKEQLVRVLKQKGHYIAMIGDGVNDVLSLKQAQLAIAMQSGSQATRAVSDIVLLNDSFALLPSAVVEGQRIIRGMQDVMRLVLTHTFYVTLFIIGCAIMEVAFPTTPKLRSIITVLTVGIPTLAIAGWARPGRPPASIVRPVLRFVLPAGFTVAAAGLGVYTTYLLMTNDVGLAQSALTTVALFCGLVLIPFAEPPGRFWVAGDELSGDKRPTILGGVMLVIYAVIMMVQPFRDFFGLRPLPILDVLLIGAVVAVWAVALRLVWKHRVFERLLGSGVR
ncbi:MAG: HAD-IC family P-type ATPase [Chloroflexota bacterium]